MRNLWLACVAAGVNGMTSAQTVSSAPTPNCTCDKELEVTVRTDIFPTSCDAGKYADEEGLDACKPADRGY